MYDNRTQTNDTIRLHPGPGRKAAARRGSQGVALLTALVMLVLFSMLGTAYIKYMSIDIDTAKYQRREVRARHLAIGGINAAIGKISGQIKRGETPGGAYDFQLPVVLFKGDELEYLGQDVHVDISDESRRINVNHAPLEVLEALGIERGTVRQLKSRLPRQGERANTDRRWLASVQELLSREFLSAEEYLALNTELLTVHTVADQTRPAGYINLNSTPPEALSALLDIDLEDASVLAEKRPFTSWNDLIIKSGKGARTYNVRPSVLTPDTMPAELSLASRCFRLESQARIGLEVSGDRSVTSTVEAVVVFDGDGDYQIQFWSKTPSEFLEYVPPVEEAVVPDVSNNADSEEDSGVAEEE
jgi:type II secretory pathway component PulK